MNELDINNPQLPDFIVPGADEKKQDEPAKIKVIGVGGGRRKCREPYVPSRYRWCQFCSL